MISFLFHSQGYYLSKHPLINFPKTWLEFNCENIKILRNKIEFKTELKKHLLNELASVINCSRLLCPTCHLNAYCRSLLVICIFKFFFEGFLKTFLFVVMLLLLLIRFLFTMLPNTVSVHCTHPHCTVQCTAML